jgi:hypothetical protein
MMRCSQRLACDSQDPLDDHGKTSTICSMTAHQKDDEEKAKDVDIFPEPVCAILKDAQGMSTKEAADFKR